LFVVSVNLLLERQAERLPRNKLGAETAIVECLKQSVRSKQ